MFDLNSCKFLVFVILILRILIADLLQKFFKRYMYINNIIEFYILINLCCYLF